MDKTRLLHRGTDIFVFHQKKYILCYEYAGAVIRQVFVSLSVEKKCSLATVHPEAQYWMLSVIYSYKITLPSWIGFHVSNSYSHIVMLPASSNTICFRSKMRSKFATLLEMYLKKGLKKILLKIESPSGHPRCRWVCFFMETVSEKCNITSLAHQWILCSEWVPPEWESKQLIKTSQ